MARYNQFGYHKSKPDYKWSQLNPKDYTSECVDVLEYDMNTNEMTVHFEKRGSYLYKGVEPLVYAEFNHAGSRGQYFNQYIRGNYESQRIR